MLPGFTINTAASHLYPHCVVLQCKYFTEGLHYQHKITFLKEHSDILKQSFFNSYFIVWHWQDEDQTQRVGIWRHVFMEEVRKATSSIP